MMHTNKYGLYGLALALCVFLHAGVAAAAEGVPFGNQLADDVTAVYATTPGNPLTKAAGLLQTGKTANVDPALMRGNRVVVTMDEPYTLQFFSSGFLDAGRRFTLKERKNPAGKASPVLEVQEGGQSFAITAGLPFHLFVGPLETGAKNTAEYAPWLNPAQEEKWKDLSGKELPFAVALADSSWSLLFTSIEGKNGPALHAILTASPAEKLLETVLEELRGMGMLMQVTGVAEPGESALKYQAVDEETATPLKQQGADVSLAGGADGTARQAALQNALLRAHKDGKSLQVFFRSPKLRGQLMQHAPGENISLRIFLR